MSKPKSSIPSTTKALQAWQSELRRLEKRLEEWANDLAQREEILEEQEEAFATAVDEADGETVQLYASKFPPDSRKGAGRLKDDECYCDEGTCDIHPDQDGECGCTPEDSKAGCDCPKCEKMRTVAGGVRRSAVLNLSAANLGDEVEWLDNLWKLDDKRKK